MLPCRENTRKLKASGNVLTNLVGSLDGRLFSNIIWRFSLDPLSPGKHPWCYMVFMMKGNTVSLILQLQWYPDMTEPAVGHVFRHF